MPARCRRKNRLLPKQFHHVGLWRCRNRLGQRVFGFLLGDVVGVGGQRQHVTAVPQPLRDLDEVDVFGYMVVQRLLLLVRVLGRLPDGVSRTYARLLGAATRPFHVINYYGSRAAALVYNRHRMGTKMNRVIASLQRSLARSTDEALRRGMHFPTRWDPFFKEYMTLEDLYRYPGQHFDFHQRQLTLN